LRVEIEKVVEMKKVANKVGFLKFNK